MASALHSRLAAATLVLAALIAAPDAAATLTANSRVGMGEGHDSILFSRLSRLDMMVLEIETLDRTWPTCDYVHAPGTAWGKSIQNQVKVPGRLVMHRGDSIVYDSGDYEHDASGITLRLRGNTSAYYDKKPYKIKLQKKADLLLRGDDAKYKDKHWLLIADESLNAMLGYEVSRIVGMPWVPGYTYVNVVINGRYEGMYMLLESVRRNTDCRIDVDKDGFIYESDPYWWNEPYFINSRTYSQLRFTFKYPDAEDLTEADKDYMAALLLRQEQCYARSYVGVIDVPSFAAWCLGHDILSTGDSAGSNRYYAKRDRSDTTLITMPVMWDFDSIERDSLDWSSAHRLLFRSLFNNPNRTFVNEYTALWQRVKPILYDSIYHVFNTMRSSRYGTAYAYSIQLDNTRWDSRNYIYNNLVYRPQWIKRRVPLLDKLIEGLAPTDDDE